MLIPIDRILPNPEQPRMIMDEDELKSLAASMHSDGLLNPIAVKGPMDSYYVLVDGERRWRAAQMLKWESIPAHVVTVSVDDNRYLVMALIGNLQRSDMGPVDEGNAFTKLRAEGMTVEDIASRVGRSTAHIYNRINMLSWGLSPQTLDALNRRMIPINDAMLRDLGKLRVDEQEKVVARAVRKCSNVTVSGVLFPRY